MKLISVSDEVMINPDKISSIEFRDEGDNKHIVVTVEHKEFILVEPRKFFDLLKSHGINTGPNNQFVRL